MCLQTLFEVLWQKDVSFVTFFIAHSPGYTESPKQLVLWLFYADDILGTAPESVSRNIIDVEELWECTMKSTMFDYSLIYLLFDNIEVIIILMLGLKTLSDDWKSVLRKIAY